MKKTALTLLGVIIAVIGLHAFKSYQATTVTGKMSTDPRRSRIIARKGSDSVEAGFRGDSTFRIVLSKGTWQLELTRWNNENFVHNIYLDTLTVGAAKEIHLGSVLPGL
jgi:hypothetical protein